MSLAGDADDTARARQALLDALTALGSYRSSVVVVGAQAIYLRTGRLQEVALAELTYDGDLAVDPRGLADNPRLEELMTAAGFRPGKQPGSWVGEHGAEVDLMVPAALAGQGGRRGARIPPHSKHAARRTPGLEAALVDSSQMTIKSLDRGDDRRFVVNVASLAALLIAKLHKLGDHLRDGRGIDNKDAHDVYRILRASDTRHLATALARLRSDPLAGEPTCVALEDLTRLFVVGSPPLGAKMAGEAEALVGSPEEVTASTQALAEELVSALSDEFEG